MDEEEEEMDDEWGAGMDAAAMASLGIGSGSGALHGGAGAGTGTDSRAPKRPRPDTVPIAASHGGAGALGHLVRSSITGKGTKVMGMLSAEDSGVVLGVAGAGLGAAQVWQDL